MGVEMLKQMCMDSPYLFVLQYIVHAWHARNCRWRLGHSKGGDVMVTYEELFALGMLIVAIITLCYLVFKSKDK